MEQPLETYEKPTVKDYGTLVELTAACVQAGSGDFEFPNDPTKTPAFSNSRGFCESHAFG